jgi:UPF0716 family protein affecting phage T7 exclusion
MGAGGDVELAVLAAESLLERPGFIFSVVGFIVLLPFAIRDVIRWRRRRRE